MRGDGPDPVRAQGQGQKEQAQAAGSRSVGTLARHDDRGQSTVELALVLPAVVLLALAIVQVGLVVRDQVVVVHAAREGARAAAVSAEPDAARRAVEESTGLDHARLEVTTGGRGAPGSRVRVTVTYRSRTDLPLVGGLIPDLTLTADATMRVER